jgi:hypothetical protein
MENVEEIQKDDDGNCIYCGEKCFEGEMCDEQQAGGFEKKKMTPNDMSLLKRGNKIERKNWAYFNLLIKEADAEETKTILRSLQSTMRIAYEVEQYINNKV